MRKRIGAKFKVKVALSALREDKTMAELSSQYQIHRVQIQQWKKQVLDNLEHLFADKRSKDNKTKDRLIDELYQQISKLKVEVDWVKKKSGQLGMFDK